MDDPVFLRFQRNGNLRNLGINGKPRSPRNPRNPRTSRNPRNTRNLMNPRNPKNANNPTIILKNRRSYSRSGEHIAVELLLVESGHA